MAPLIASRARSAPVRGSTPPPVELGGVWFPPPTAVGWVVGVDGSVGVVVVGGSVTLTVAVSIPVVAGPSGIGPLGSGRTGVPLYVMYLPGAEPAVLPQVLTPDLVIEAINGGKP